jgi:hypothetical protein
MLREKPRSGEIFEPKTVQDRVDLTANSRMAVPLIIDLETRTVIWCDMSVGNTHYWVNNVHTAKKGLGFTAQALTEMIKPNLYDLLMLHAKARGVVVKAKDQADTVFSLEAETPFRQEEIAANFLQ